MNLITLLLCAVALPAVGALVMALCWAAARADKRTVRRG